MGQLHDFIGILLSLCAFCFLLGMWLGTELMHRAHKQASKEK